MQQPKEYLLSQLLLLFTYVSTNIYENIYTLLIQISLYFYFQINLGIIATKDTMECFARMNVTSPPTGNGVMENVSVMQSSAISKTVVKMVCIHECV